MIDLQPAALVLAVVTLTAGLWRTVLMVRTPRPDRLQLGIVVVCFSLFASNLLNLRALAATLDVPAPGLAGVVRNVAIVASSLGIILLFASAAGDRPFARTRVQVTVAVTAVVALLGCWLTTLPQGAILTYQGIGPDSPTGALAFFVVGSVYLAYSDVAAGLLQLRAANRSSRRWFRIVFRVWACQSVLALLSGPTVRGTTVVLLITGRPRLPAVVQSTATVALTLSSVLFVVCLCCLALPTVVGKGRRWVASKRRTMTVYPLWSDLREAFPNIVLQPRRSRLGELFRMTDVPYSYRRKLMECRDGLWCLSPYVADGPDDEPVAPLSFEHQAALVRDGLRRLRAGDGPVGGPVAVARADTWTDDEHALLALARSFVAVSGTADPDSIDRDAEPRENIAP